uniref:Alpha-carbonic anhydrase domain-containing protein n=1 Tax=Chrysemys picta bellii TaxID=8478 RepID=A0A8C3HJA7_CHRPI
HLNNKCTCWVVTYLWALTLVIASEEKATVGRELCSLAIPRRKQDTGMCSGEVTAEELGASNGSPCWTIWGKYRGSCPDLGHQAEPCELSTHPELPCRMPGSHSLCWSHPPPPHHVKVRLADGLHLCAQGLPATYTAKSFHLHWSQGSDKPGSEHFINHKGFSMEVRDAGGTAPDSWVLCPAQDREQGLVS